ncbi:MAG: hypothetical protein FJY85_16610 [Deltaproteobacteria bacterium]|nr:hypothetical protein [Deltaproteobacteria bacterium]
MSGSNERRYELMLGKAKLLVLKIEPLGRNRQLVVITDPNPEGFHLTDIVEGGRVKPHTSGVSGRHLPDWNARKTAYEMRLYLERHIFHYHHNRLGYLPTAELLRLSDQCMASLESGGQIDLELLLAKAPLEDERYFSRIRLRHVARTYPHFCYAIRRGGANFVLPVDRNRALFIPVSYLQRTIKEILRSVGLVPYLDDYFRIHRDAIKRRIDSSLTRYSLRP